MPPPPGRRARPATIPPEILRRSSRVPKRYRAVKAYENPEFMSTADARMLRILSEYLEP